MPPRLEPAVLAGLAGPAVLKPSDPCSAETKQPRLKPVARQTLCMKGPVGTVEIHCEQDVAAAWCGLACRGGGCMLPRSVRRRPGRGASADSNGDSALCVF